MTGIDLNQYLGAFLDEATDNLLHLDDLLLEIEKDQGNMEVINEIFRSAHTLKGMSATMGFDRMSTLTHSIEDRLDKVRRGEAQLQSGDIDLLFRSLDTLQTMVEAIRNGDKDTSISIDDLIEALHQTVPQKDERQEENTIHEVLSDHEEQWIHEANSLGMDVFKVDVRLSKECMLKAARAYMVVNRLDEMGDIIKTAPPVEDLENEKFDRSFEIYIATHDSEESLQEALSRISELEKVSIEKAGSPSWREKEQEKVGTKDVSSSPEKEVVARSSAESITQNGPSRHNASKRAGQTVRVDIGRLDKLMNLVGELVIGRARIERLVQEARLRDFDEPLSQLGRISGDIQELVTKLRMVPVSFIFDRFPRLVRDLSKSMEKKIDLQIEGQDTELDRTVIDEIGDPLVHLIRNSIDHGIEKPEDRVKTGKTDTGVIKISAYQEGSGVIIEVDDDGKGINSDRVREKAVEKGFITEEESYGMTEEELIQLVLLPGFSTSDAVTDISGRGVGMDAVKTKVEALSGQFEIESMREKGTRVLIRLPLTLAIVLALLVKVGDEIYAISLENVEETILVRKEDIKTMHGTPATLLRGDVLALSNLASLLGTHLETDQQDEYPVVVVKAGRNKVGFIVSELIGQQEIVIKSLGKFLSKIKGIAGATILGDGNVALILDVASLCTK
ncbi:MULTISPECIES: chemotaxis protein CheA [Aminobacterium]|uniref:chemotaxis protein CheA n=1 Tax=Aminobacterium TaxID=81466 RepID=UPI00257BCA07|nr:chemotaxis protein CheA [Aminobacterium sp. UBA4834]